MHHSSNSLSSSASATQVLQHTHKPCSSLVETMAATTAATNALYAVDLTDADLDMEDEEMSRVWHLSTSAATAAKGTASWMGIWRPVAVMPTGGLVLGNEVDDEAFIVFNETWQCWQAQKMGEVFMYVPGNGDKIPVMGWLLAEDSTASQLFLHEVKHGAMPMRRQTPLIEKKKEKEEKEEQFAKKAKIDVKRGGWMNKFRQLAEKVENQDWVGAELFADVLMTQISHGTWFQRSVYLMTYIRTQDREKAREMVHNFLFQAPSNTAASSSTSPAA